jgi:hypothetical protein
LVVKTHFSKKLKKKERGLFSKVKEKLNKENNRSKKGKIVKYKQIKKG